MKKLLLLFAVLLGTVGAWAQTGQLNNPDQVFKLKCKALDLYLSVETPNVNEGIKVKTAEAADKQDFFIIPTPSEGYYFLQCASGDFVVKVNPWHAKTESQPTAFWVEEVNPGEYRFYNKMNQSGYLGPNKNSSGDGAVIYSNHTTDNPNIIWVLEESSVDSEVLANAKEKRNNICVNPTDFPNTQAFKLKNPNGHYLTLTTTESNGGLDVRESVDDNKQKFFLFASPENDGYFLQNANTHALKVIPGWSAQSNQQEASLLQIENPEFATYKLKSTLGYIGVNPNGSVNGDGSKVGAVIYSNQSADNANAKWKFELAEVSDDVLKNVIDKREVYNTAYLNLLLANWKEAILAKMGYVGWYPKEMISDVNAVSTYSDAKSFNSQNNDKRIPLTDGYYLLRGTGTGNNANWYLTHKINNGAECLWAMAPSSVLNADYIWKFETVGDAYKIKCCNLNTYFTLKTATNGGDNNTYVTDPEAVEMMKFSRDDAARFTIKNADNENIRTEPDGQVNYWSGESNETWYIIPATEINITIGEAGYATTYLPFDVTLPNTVKAYAVTETSASNATMTEKEDIPANTGAILEGQGTHTLTIAEASSDWTGNMLLGSNVATEITGPGYVLSKVDGVVALYAAKLTEGKFLNNANKAYLPAAGNNARALTFNFGGNETAIESVEGENENAKAVVYDLAGRRVQNAQKGVFIINGKVVVK